MTSWLSRRSRRTRRVLAMLAATAVALVVVELALRATMPYAAASQPAFDVLFLTPDRVVGWKHPKNFQFFWNGHNPYCIEFGVQVSTNSFGFRDREWSLEKAPGTTRIAVLGDSFIEAIQVPLQDTVPRQLETRLAARVAGARIETMNFGVSNYSLGQYLMTYDQYARQFRPDYVVVVAAYLNFMRTTQPELSSWLQDFYTLHVRPSYELDAHGNLVYVPARDYDRYEAAVAAALESHYGDDRSRPIHRFPSPLYLTDVALRALSRNVHPAELLQRDRSPEAPVVELNYHILQELHRRVSADGATLLFADAFDYLDGFGGVSGSEALVSRNRAFIQSLGADYVDLSGPLRQAPSNPQYACDQHFNVTGNHAIAEALAQWFASRL
jgi:lysophospholipase L1-like esterase